MDGDDDNDDVTGPVLTVDRKILNEYIIYN